MSSDKCFWCQTGRPVTTDEDGDACCARCLPLLDPDGRCGHCDGDGMPVKMLGLYPACIACLNRHHLVQRATPTVRAQLEAMAAEAGVTGDIWSLTVTEFVSKVLEARCLKLGLVKARGVDVAAQVVGNEVGR